LRLFAKRREIPCSSCSILLRKKIDRDDGVLL
jgi:hypothetical protein